MQKLLLLHGALGAKEQFEPLREVLKNDFEIHTINFSGHGGREIPKEDFSIPLFAEDVLKWMSENKIDTINVFGYSMGGYVALYSAGKYHGKIGKIFTLATKFDWSEKSAEKETKMLDPEKIKEKVPSFADELIKRHGADKWEQVLKKTAWMMTDLGKNPLLTGEKLSKIEKEVQLSVGDRDRMVTIEETINAYRNLKNAKLLVLANTLHPIEAIDVFMLCREIRKFFKIEDKGN